MRLMFRHDTELLSAGEALKSFLPIQPWYVRHTKRWRLGDMAYRRLKRLMDIGVCLVALPIVFPILMLCGIAIKLDSSGPLFFLQERTGNNGDRFMMVKLRTMLTNAEKMKDQYFSLNKLSYPDFKIPDDPRITRVGRFLRKTSLDELPQIFNVLRGEMSLVGPRPTSFHADTYSLWHTARLESTPGITGLWQVSGRDELDFDERSRLDIAYIQHQSLWLDMQIMLRTIGCVISRRGAH